MHDYFLHNLFRSVRLTDLDDSTDAWDPNMEPTSSRASEEPPTALDNASEKALSKLGLEERWKHRSRQIIL